MNSACRGTLVHVHATTVLGMSHTYRRPRGTPTVAMHLFVAPEVKERIDAFAAAAKMPIWAVVEAAIRAAEPGPEGYPESWGFPVEPTLDFAVAKEAKTKAA